MGGLLLQEILPLRGSIFQNYHDIIIANNNDHGDLTILLFLYCAFTKSILLFMLVVVVLPRRVRVEGRTMGAHNGGT